MTRKRRTTNIGKLAVLEDKEPLSSCNLTQGLGGPVGPVCDNVAVCLEEADVVADLLGNLQEFGGGLDVGGQTKVGLLD
jgi:hypothetical protein